MNYEILISRCLFKMLLGPCTVCATALRNSPQWQFQGWFDSVGVRHSCLILTDSGRLTTGHQATFPITPTEFELPYDKRSVTLCKVHLITSKKQKSELKMNIVEAFSRNMKPNSNHSWLVLTKMSLIIGIILGFVFIKIVLNIYIHSTPPH